MKQFMQSAIRRRVLVVDDEIINREILKAILAREYEVYCAENGRQALEMLRDSDLSYSLVILDLFMPVMDGFEVIKACKADEKLRTVPLIVTTSEKSAEVRSIRMGAADFITKPYDLPDVILARCQRIIELSEDKTIISYTERESLTNLYTKQYFDEYIRRLIPEIDKEMDAVELRIDRFSLMKEIFGREECRSLLREAAAIIARELIYSRGIACRTEDNCFWIYCEHRSDYEGLIRRLQKELTESSGLHGIHLRAGIYEFARRDIPFETWFERARAACERVCGQYARYTAVYNRELHERSMLQHRLIGDMQEAINDRDFTVYYQPKYNIQGETPVLVSAEALVRWNHRELGMLSPAAFIPLFEQNGLIRKVDAFVWREAAAQTARWKEKYGVSIPVSVNVSRVDLFNPALADRLTGLLEEFGLEPRELMLEITESAYSDDDEAFIAALDGLRERGFRLEMDDFGTGYSSLNMLTVIPFDVLKMDMSFIRNMFRDEKSLKMVELVMEIAAFLNVPVVAEGVEEQRQLDELKRLGCGVVQGYYFSAPVPPERFEDLIRSEL